MKQAFNILAFLLCFPLFILCQSHHIVTSIADNGPGTLRYYIDFSSDGDTISFAPSISEIELTSGQLSISKSLVVKSESNQVRIYREEENELFRIFFIHSDSSINVHLENLEISGGHSQFEPFYGSGGGIYFECRRSSLNVKDCNINNNQSLGIYSGMSGGNGGGIFVRNNDSIAIQVTISNSIFSNNMAGDALPDNYQAGKGGAICTKGSITLTIESCEFISNESGDGRGGLESFSHGGHGGAVSITDDTNLGKYFYVIVKNCFFKNNLTGSGGEQPWYPFGVGDAGSGAAIYFRPGWSQNISSLTLDNCLIANNEAGTGSRWDCATAIQGHNIQMYNSTIANNLPTENFTSAERSAVYFLGTDNVVYNSIIYGNPLLDENFDIRGDFVSYNSLIGRSMDAFNGSGNLLNTSPSFIDSTSDYRLSYDSPCIDKGYSDTIYVSEYDLDGNPRIMNTEVDMGCYEYQYPLIVEQQVHPNKTSIFPNPASDFLILELLNRNYQNGIYTCQVYDAKGNVCMTTSFSMSRKKIDIRDLKAGNYILNVLQNNKVIGSEKFVVLR